MRYRLAGTVAALGLMTGYIGGAMMHFPPFLPQRLLQVPAVDILVVALALGTVASLALWARQAGHPERRAFVAVIITAGGVAVILNVLAPTAGWWGGRVFEAPLFPLALLTGLRAMFLIALLLLLYRWLAARNKWLALLIYLLILVALIPAVIIVDPILLRSDVLEFGAGYTIWHDVVVGEVAFALTLILYELFHRYLHLPTCVTHNQ
ncbi:MAG: hypothetical protein WAU45_20995 [Blastocatellia bacterium]